MFNEGVFAVFNVLLWSTNNVRQIWNVSGRFPINFIVKDDEQLPADYQENEFRRVGIYSQLVAKWLIEVVIE